MKQTINTMSVTYDPNDREYIIVCPECGEYVYYSARHKLKVQCQCGYYWTVKHIAIGRLPDKPHATSASFIRGLDE